MTTAGMGMTTGPDPRLAATVFVLLAGRPSAPADWSRLGDLLDAIGGWLMAIDGAAVDERDLLVWIAAAGVQVEADAAGDLLAGVSAAGLARLRGEVAALVAAADGGGGCLGFRKRDARNHARPPFVVSGISFEFEPLNGGSENG